MPDEIYRQIIIDRYHQPKFRGELPDATFVSKESNPLCGDTLDIGLKIEDGKISGVAWNGDGCAISQAAADLLSEQLIGKTVDDILKLTNDDMLHVLGVDLGPARLKCATLGLVTVKKALSARGA